MVRYDQRTIISNSKKNGIIEGLLKAKELGLIKSIGISAHCNPKDLIEWAKQAKYCELIMLPVNLMNTYYLDNCLSELHEMGMKILIMNPLCGGSIPPQINQLLKKLNISSFPELSIRYLKSNKNIDGILLGIMSAQDVDSAFTYLSKNDLTEGEINIIRKFQNNNLNSNICTKCKYCLPCPQEINIPEVLEFLCLCKDLNKKISDNIKEWTKNSKIRNCIKCMQCEIKCPNKIKITSIIDEFLNSMQSFKQL